MMDNLALQIAVHVFVHGTVILAIAWVAVRGLSDWPAASKHATWTTAFAVLLLLPAAYGALPGWELNLIPTPSDPNDVSFYSAVPSPPVEASPDGAYQDPADATASDLSDSASYPAASSDSGETSGLGMPLLPASRWLAPIFLLIWAGGVLLLLGRLGLGMISLWRWKQHATAAGCSGLARRLARQLDLRRPVKVRGSAKAHVPIAWGVVSPAIILPAEAEQWPRKRLTAVLLHELAHVKRWDYLTHLLGRVARAFFWLNPLIWKAVEQSSAVQEQACDDAVLQSGIAPWTYAEQLLAVVKTLHQLSPTDAVAINAGLRFKSRMRALLRPTTPRRAMTRWEMSAIGLAGVGLLAAMSAFHVGSSSHDRHEHHWIEAESAARPPAFERKEDEEASQGTYVKVIDRARDIDREPETDPAVYSFETSRAGRHVVWARVRVHSNRHDSFWIRVDSTEWIRWNGIEEGNRWHWVQVRDADRDGRPVAFDLAEGEHELMLAQREDGIAIDRLLVTTDWNYQPRDTGTPSPLDSDHRICLEAEEGEIEAPLRIANTPDASNWQHLEAQPGASSRSSPPEAGHATYTFAVPHDGTYRLWGRVIAETNDDDSFWVRMDDGRWIRWNGIEQGDQWRWDEVHDAERDKEPVRFELSKGTHQLTIAYRESDAKLDRLLLTSNPTYRPRGFGERPDSLDSVSQEFSITDAALTDPMVLRADSQSADPQPWIEVPDGSGNDPPEGGPGAATFTFSVPHSGRYVFWGEVQAPNRNDNSFYVSVDDGEEFAWHTPAPRKTTDGWIWDPISEGRSDAFTDPAIFTLEEGTHQLRIRNREDGTRLRKLRITNMPLSDRRPIMP